MPDVTMPRLSDSMEEATIVNWLVADGDTVAIGQELAEVETDKATVSFVAEAAGRIEVLAAAGETVPLGGMVARILTADEQTTAPSPPTVEPPPAVEASTLPPTPEEQTTAEPMTTSPPAAPRRNGASCGHSPRQSRGGSPSLTASIWGA